MATAHAEPIEPPLKKFKKIPVYVVEEHNDALQFIYSAIGGRKLPVEGTTLVHLDAHPDLLINRNLLGTQARSGRELLPLLDIENWIVPAAAAGHLAHIVWLRPPWAKQFKDGTRTLCVGDHPDSGLLRVSCPEPYYLSDALYTPELKNERCFKLSVAELGDPDCLRSDEDAHVKSIVKNLNINPPNVLDIDLDFFSTGNPFLALYDRVNLYDQLEPIYEFELPKSEDPEEVLQVTKKREQQLGELEALFNFLQEFGSLDEWTGVKTELFEKVQSLSLQLVKEYGQEVDWQAVQWAGCTRDQGGLPAHKSSPQELESLIKRSLKALLKNLPPPVLVTVARSSRDEYCPLDQVDQIQDMVLEQLKQIYDVDEPVLYYLND